MVPFLRSARFESKAFLDKEDFFPNLVHLVGLFPNLYCDTAVLASRFRWRNLPRLLETPEHFSRMAKKLEVPERSSLQSCILS